MRGNSKKKGGPVMKIQVPTFEFQKANQYEQYYQKQIETSFDQKDNGKNKLKKDDKPIPSLLKDEGKKAIRQPSGKNIILKPLDQEVKNGSFIQKQKYFESNSQWINDLTKKEQHKVERPARNPDRLNDSFNRTFKIDSPKKGKLSNGTINEQASQELNKSISAPSKNLKDYDCWDQDLTPEAWLQKYQGRAPPHGQSPIYSQGEYRWTDIELLNYDKASGKFYVRVLQNGLLKFVNRLSLKFRDEDSDNFNLRVQLSKSRQKHAQQEIKLMKYIDNIPDNLVSQVPDRIINALKNHKIQKIGGESHTYDKNFVFPGLLNDFKKIHIDFEKKFLLYNPQISVTNLLLPEPIPTPAPLEKQSDITYTRYGWYQQSLGTVVKNHVSRRPKQVRCEKLILHKGTQIISKYPLWGSLLDSKQPILLAGFIDRLQLQTRNSIQSWTMIWRSHIISQIQDILKQQYRFFVTEKKLYEEDRLKKVINKFELLFNTVIRTKIFDDSIAQYMRFLKQYILPPNDQPYLIKASPLIILQLNVNPIKKKKQKKKSKKQIKQIEEQVQQTVFYEPNIDTIQESLTIPFDILHKFSQTFFKLQKDLLPLLNLEPVASFSVPRQDPLLFNPSNQALNIIKESFKKPQQILEEFKAFTHIIEKSPSSITKKLFPTEGKEKQPHVMYIDREQITNKLKEYSRDKSIIQTLAIDEVNCGLFQVRTHSAKQVFISRIGEVLNQILKRINQMCHDNVGRILGLYTQINQKLKIIPTKESELFELKKVVGQNETAMQKIKNEVQMVNKYLLLMEDYLYKVDDQTFQNFWSLKEWPQKIKQELMEANRIISQKQSKFSQNLESQKDIFSKNLVLLEKQLEVIKNFSDYGRVLQNSKQTSLLNEKILESQQKVKSFNQRQELFKMIPSTYQSLDALIQHFEPYFKLWNNCVQFDVEKKQSMTNPFLKLNYTRIQKRVNQEFYRAAIQLTKVFDDLSNQAAQKVVAEFKRDVQKFRQRLWLIQLLTTEALIKKPIYWKQIAKQCNVQNLDPTDDLTLQGIIEAKLENYRQQIEQISKKAEKQWSLEKKLNGMVQILKNLRVDTLKYKNTGTYVLKGIDEAQQTLDDQLNILLMMKASPYIKPVLGKATTIETKIILIQDTLEGWLKTQRGWMYLQPIFASQDIKQKMQNQKNKFDWVDKNWRSTMQQFSKQPNLWQNIQSQKYKSEFDNSNRILDQIQKSLSEYLETKRRFFPRFYFLSDEQLLQILAQTKDPETVQRHINKCFEAIAQLHFTPQQHVSAMISAEKQRVEFIKNVDVNEGEKKGNVQRWLSEIQAVMINTLKRITKDSLNDSTDRVKWVRKWPAQTVLAVNMMRWTAGAEQAIQTRNIKQYVEKLKLQLKEIVVLVRQQLTQLQRLTLGALVTIDVHGKDVIEGLQRDNCRDIQDFNWIAQLRYYWDQSGKSHACKVKMINAQLHYGFEYLGNSNRLVITPLTDRCYRTLMGAFHLNYGGAPQGPAGTGKTQTVKDLAKALAVQCVVFNCSDGLNYIAMRKFFKGLASSGAWCCFDEFNRIDLEVLSVIAQQVLTIQTAIRERRRLFNFDGEDITLVLSCAINITMNPGYAGRSDLPDNLKALFRPCAMMVPDYAMIGEIYLYSVGFEEARNLARKIVASLRLSSQQLSSQDHYDFGMRALKAILTAAGNLKRTMLNDSQDIVCLRALMDVNIPKFTVNDVPLFSSITSDLFPETKLPDIDYGKLLESLKQYCKDNKLQPEQGFLNKCIQLYDTINVRHGLMVVGAAFSGKSKVIETLGRGISSLKGIQSFVEVALVKLNPKSITSDQLYGKLDPNTKSWSDGVVAIIMRKCAEDAELKQRKWVIFDGPVDAKWIQNMNTVLDDNKKLCLTSGEIIKLTNWMTMMFQVQDLSQASPATVSRCGMVFLETKQLGWYALIKTFILNLTQNLSKQKQLLQNRFKFLCNAALGWTRKYAKFLIHRSEMTFVSTMLKIFGAFITDYQGQNVKLPKQIDEIITNIALFSMIWSIGAAIQQTSRKPFNEFISKLITAQSQICQIFKFDTDYPFEPHSISTKLPQKPNYFQYFYNKQKQMYQNWSQTVPAFLLPKNISYNDLLIPTIDSIRNNFFLHLNIKNHMHVLFSGPTGTGKSVQILNELYNNYYNQQYTFLSTAFSGQTISNQVQRVIESKVCTRRRKGYFGPEEGKNQIVIFIDDLNMPQKEIYGAQPPIQLLRQWMDTGGWYDLDTKEWKYLCSINFVAAMLPSTGGRNVVTMRYLRHYNLIYVQPFQAQSLVKIFGSVLEWYFINLPQSLPKAITNLKQNIVSSTIQLYNKVQTSKQLLPTPAKSHYIYNLRDLSKVFQGITKANNRSLVSQNDMVKLWAHQCSRIFKDRLINLQDQSFFDNMLKQLIKSNFRKDWNSLVTIQPVLWASFIPTIYPDGDTSKKPLNDIYCELTNRQNVKKKCYEYLDQYNNFYTGNRMNLVLFMAAIQHIIKIVRILTTTFGHALLVGVGGSGRKSLAMLSSYIAFQNQYSEVDSKNWVQQVQKIMKNAGLQQKSTVFLFSDTQILKQSMVQQICNILNNGQIPNLFPAQEKAKIVEEISLIKPVGSVNQKYQYFVSLCKKNLHMVICMSPVGQDFRRRLRTFPSLVNCTTIDWFLPWPQEALVSTADNHFMSVMKIEDEKLRKGLVQICVDMQMRVTLLTKRYYQELRRYYYVTPTSYLELLGIMHKLLKQRKTMIQNQIQRYQTGVNKITTTEAQVGKMQKELQDLQPKLEKATIQNKALLVNLQKSQKDADAKKAICQTQEKQCNIQRDQANKLRADCQKDLDLVLPLLDEAAQALDKISQDQMTQLKSYVNPPVSAAVVMEGVCYAFNQDQNIKFTPKQPGSMEKIQDFWGYSKKNLLNSKLMQRVKKFRQDAIKAIPPAKIAKLKVFITKPEFQKQKVFTASKAAGSLSMWIRAVVNTYEALLVVEPKKLQLVEAETKLSKAQAILNEKKKNLQEVLDLLANLEAEYQTAKKKKQELQANVARVKIQLQRAEKLIKGLANEKIAWGKKVIDWGEEEKGLLGDCVICSGIIAYLGAFPIAYRQITIAAWQDLLKKLSIRSADKFSLQNVLSDPLTTGLWVNTQELPNDDFSIDNAIILKNSTRWPLMIDPQIQANNWIKNMEDKNLIILRQNKPFKQIYFQIENAMTLGYPVLLQNLSQTVDAIFQPVLQKKLVKSGGSWKIKFGDKLLDYNSDFRFYMTTKLGRPHYPPEICVKVTILNFQVTLQGLDDQMLNIVVKMEQPIKQQQKQRNIKDYFENKNKQKATEDLILKLLNQSKGNLLDDSKLIDTLQSSKIQSKQIEQKMEKLQYSKAQFALLRNSFKEVSKRASNLYFIILDLAGIEPTYQWSLEFYLALYKRGIQKAIPGKQNRCKNIIERFQLLFYQSICRSLLQKDKLIFSFMIFIKILQSEGKISANQIRFLMVGGTWTQTDQKLPEISWLSNKTWCTICQLSKSIPLYEGFNEDFKKYSLDWTNIYNTQDPFESKFPGKWGTILNGFQRLLILRIIRPDKFSQSIQKLITKQLSSQYIEPPPFNLEQAYLDSDPFTPLIFILSPGADPRIQITNLAQKTGFKNNFTALSLGQGQGIIAQNAIKVAIAEGKWVLLQNCHLAPSFMPDLQRIHQNIANQHKDFRLWLTSMPSNIFPVTILMKGIKMTYQPPRGLKNNLLRSFATQDKVKFEQCKKPKQWKKMFMGLSFFHALILERRKYGPLGWNIPYEFTAADFAISQSQLKMFLDEYENIPYEALNYMVAEANYGGRVTDPHDRRLIKIILKQFYANQIIQDKFILSKSGIYKVLDEPTFDTCMDYIKTLPMNDLTEVFGLHNNAQISSAIIQTDGICSTILSLLPRDVGGAGASAEELIKQKIKLILVKLPKQFDVDEIAKKHPVMYAESMNTVLQQQLLRFNKLLQTVRSSLINVDKAIDGFVVMSQQLEIVFNSLFDNKVPDLWHKVSYPSLKPLGSWINDFVQRLKFMQKWVDQGAPSSFWISGFFFTQSFLTGTLQNYARKYKIPIDTLNFDFHVIPPGSRQYDIKKGPTDGCYVYGLFIDGARWDENLRCLNESINNILYYNLPYLWLLPTQDKKQPSQNEAYSCPVYKTSLRRGTLSTTGHSTNYVLSIQLPIQKHTNSDHWVKRGVAMLTQLND